ncbi:hypothetical protein ERO13_D11G221100v2 [Gossypium hirsutum]|uniref:Mitochondrial adenine nucleotide transporter BTL3 n=4 Tax=Gossypium TaxID=3633 RepID=A0A5J5PEU7_GOSBA|nr:probable mitochondrial adenine nucleotide transporter BTL3 [Gossypium hirsutum]KAB2004946.1 hypothetical protein ES319_D11G235600v1 [Gossypium barbadense]KAG4121655.1 hypothetical protein ERO13_D11G221100v2 [Gossypium hirsutum]TYG46336.1 hypothetical protein ES288_D11G249000v1 [Gossypium darwinii]TYH45198.1 hypothetical protein ES332_D11G248200v1 [Gossypium tomentosum]
MYGPNSCLYIDTIRASQQWNTGRPFLLGGLFLNDQTLPSSFVSFISLKAQKCPVDKDDNLCFLGGGKSTKTLRFVKSRRDGRGRVGWFLSVSLSSEEGYVGESGESWGQNGDKNLEEVEMVEGEKEKKGSGALNTTKHLWAGAGAAMVSRTLIAPLERLKLEYILRGEKKHFIELIKSIAVSEGLIGFWKGNFVNILRTAPFKAINFYAYDTYRNQQLKLSGKEEASNFERFLAGAAAGITATLLCLPLDTIRTVMVAPGGEALGGLFGTFRHMVQTEGFFSLYKGLVPTIISMAPSGAVFYGVYDMLKSAYLHSPKGRKRIQDMKRGVQELNAFEQLELGPIRTLLYGAIAGACSEAATYPFEVVRRHLQMQVRATKLSAFATCVKIVEEGGGMHALYAGLIPSILQVLPSAAISYLVYEFMKIVLKVESA